MCTGSSTEILASLSGNSQIVGFGIKVVNEKNNIFSLKTPDKLRP